MNPNEWVLFVSMLFSFRGAPLIMERLAGMMSRQWEAVFDGQATMQCYMDDPVIIVAGNQKQRDSVVSRILYLAEIFGVQLAYEKGERGSKICWIGVSLEICQESKTILVRVPQKLVDEILQKMGAWSGYVSLREFKSVTGKLSWIACRHLGAHPVGCGVLLRGAGELRARGAAQHRGGEGSQAGQGQASQAWDDARAQSGAAQAMAGELPQAGGDLAAAGQALLEAWTVLLSIRYWRGTLKGGRLLLKSDSTVALALARKLSSSTPTLNFVGGELAILMDALQMQDIVTHHLPGKYNLQADYLSRPDLPGHPPGRLRDVSIRQDAGDYAAPTRR
eukprot:s1947_g5.t1